MQYSYNVSNVQRTASKHTLRGLDRRVLTIKRHKIFGSSDLKDIAIQLKPIKVHSLSSLLLYERMRLSGGKPSKELVRSQAHILQFY
jgi:hypothetical protein